MTVVNSRDRCTRPRGVATTVLMVATAAAVSACGGSSKPAASGSSRYQQAVQYSACMRSHGAPGFPDPTPTGNGGASLIVHAGPGSQIDPASPSFQSAQTACAKLSPKGAGARVGGIPASAKKQALKFSACMRIHGVPGFPDPVFSASGAHLQLLPDAGVTRSSPAFKAAEKACGSPLPGGVVSSVGPG